MSLEFRANEVRLYDTCGADEALELSDWLASADLPKANLGGCTNLHPALLQTLLTFRPAISVEPNDPFLSRWILPMLAPVPDEE